MSKLSYRTIFILFLIVAIFIVLTGCKEEPPPPVERIRAIKTIIVMERASGVSRKFPGSVEAVDKSSLSFEVSGHVKDLRVKVGDSVKRGQVMATLDRQSFELKVQAAEAEVKRVEADLANKEKNFQRYEKISKVEEGAVSQRALDQSQAAYESATNTLSYTKTQLNLAKRDLDKTSLSAPFDAVTAVRHVEPFQEINRGQPIYDIFMKGAMEILIDIPETVIESIYLGLPAEIRFPKSPKRTYKGIVSEVGQAASNASTFSVKVALKDTVGNIRPGMSAEVNLMLASGDKESGFLIPIHAIVPGDQDTGSSIFIFDSETSTVKKTQVEAQVSVDNNIVATKGVKPGDRIAVAGVSYLRDGQPVKLME